MTGQRPGEPAARAPHPRRGRPAAGRYHAVAIPFERCACSATIDEEALIVRDAETHRIVECPECQ